MKYILLHDKETGDTNSKKGDVLTAYYGMVDEEGKLVDELRFKLKPDGDRMPMANPDALRVNGIDLRLHMSDSEIITYSEAKDKLRAFLGKYREKGKWSNIVPLGFNLGFDLTFEYEYLLSQEEWEKYCSYNYIDVKRDCDFLKRCGWLPRELGKLVTYVEYFNLPKRDAHNDREDCLMTLDVHKAIKSFMDSQKTGGTSQDLISLLEAE